jgi:heptosyltransferase-1
VQPERGARVLIVKTSSLGDVVHALPAVSDLARVRPGIRIDWVVEEAFADVPRLHPAVAQVIPVALRRWRRAPLAAESRAGIGAVRRLIRDAGYTLTIDCQGLIKSAIVAHFAGAPVAGFDWRSAREPLATLWYDARFRVDRALHAVERNRHLVAAALDYAPAGAPRFDIAPAAGERDVPFADPVPYAVLLTNASRTSKLWPDDGWRRVIDRLARRGLSARLYWGSEAERAATTARAGGAAAQVMPRASIGSIAGSLAGARFVVGLDTGLTHLAAALGVPTIGIFCDYDPALAGIVGPAPCVSLGGRGGGPSPEQVLAAIETLLPAQVARR